MKINFKPLVVMAILFATGCVSTKKFNALQSNYNSLHDQQTALVRDNEDCKNSLGIANSKIGSLQDQLTSERSHVAVVTICIR